MIGVMVEGAKMVHTIKSPNDLKDLSIESLKKLADEIRSEIITVVTQNGGHLGSSLGAVDLILALHKVFDTPNDHIIFDVGHQAYAHKIVTGRGKQFKTIRTYRGLSGFTNRFESRYDHFTSGHAGPSISVASGVQEAFKHKGKKEKVVAVIGDGSFTSGISFEALNHAGILKNDLVIILNDNKMSISENVGAMSRWLSQAMVGERYLSLKESVKTFLKSGGKVMEPLLHVAHHLANSTRALFTAGMLFEGLGFQYVGPIDGHNFQEMLDTFERVKRIKRPVVIHTITQKGKGYRPSEENPLKYHGVSPQRGAQKGGISWTDIFSDHLVKMGAQYDDIVAITAAMPAGTGLDQFYQYYPDRFYDVGIAEQHAVAFASGLAHGGMKPFVSIYSSFLQRSIDQIFHELSLQKLNVVLIIDRGGIVGEDGETHQGVFDIALTRVFPNIVIMTPKDQQELCSMMETAYHYQQGPIVIRFPRGEAICSKQYQPQLLPIGTFEITFNAGDELGIIAIGWLNKIALDVAKQLQKEGIKVTVINGRFIKPLDHQMLQDQFQRIKRWITLEEHVVSGGFGSAILEWRAKNGFYTPCLPIALPDELIPHGKQEELRKLMGLTQNRITAQIKSFLKNH